MTKAAAKTIPAGAIATIIESLNKVLAPLDAANLERCQEWAKARCQALVDFNKSDEAKALSGNSWALYRARFGICGGKTWWNVFNGGYHQGVRGFIIKNCAAGVEKRNYKIAAKLADASVTAVHSEVFTSTSDGFDGMFEVDTDKGQKLVTIRTIYAGGHNIQCLHVRVLVKVH